MASEAQRYRQLIEQIRQHDRAYYVEDQPQISDAAYDQLYRQLRDIEAAHPEWVRPDSPTQRVGGEVVAKFAKVKHPEPMLSLDNLYDNETLLAFCRRCESGLGKAVERWVAEPKIDGLSLELHYQDRRLVSAATRGDGEVGEEVVHNIKTIRHLPLTLPSEAPSSLVVRGEVLLEKSALELVNLEREAAGEPLFKNCRNAAAGSVRLLDSRIAAKRPLRFLAWGVVQGQKLASGHDESLARLRAWGLPTLKPESFTTVATLLSYLQGFAETRHQLAFPVDGMVVKVDRFADQQSLGFTSKYPRFAAAYKYETVKAITQVRDIRLQVGRTGALTPVAEFDPVEVSGSLVARASLHNEDEIRRKDLRLGDWVEVEKAGEVIPQVVRVLTARRNGSERSFVMPTNCPSCAKPVTRLGDEVALRCTNRACGAQFREALLFFAGRDCMNLERLGPAVVDQLLAKGLVKDLADLFTLDQAQLLTLERLGEKSAQNLLAGIAQARQNATLTDLITALGIPNIGRVAAGTLANHFGSLAAMLDAKRLEGLEELSGIGPIMATAIRSYLREVPNRQLLNKFLKLGIDPKPMSNGQSQLPLRGSSFCITGSLSAPRGVVRKLIEQNGGVFHASVTSTTTYLIQGEGDDDSKKAMLAKKHGTKIISETEFRKLLPQPL